MKDGLGGQRLQVVLPGQSQSLQEERQRGGEARGLPVELSGGQQHPAGRREAQRKCHRHILESETHLMTSAELKGTSEAAQHWFWLLSCQNSSNFEVRSLTFFLKSLILVLKSDLFP